ncbi:hypothetical protein N7468_000023 [Penicillium chermesinum]|uniref:Uncharacterized protein n=1 Tax=Penicillium chermesinum TaxID=63820 RepID=A0A9W9TY26_9EURO|nr:uncharacterized protein N7468_000023 [Penicillium chermesinum]KAJ5248572.1 hypothetical protein N7468_000023 [Penicillium chermesinum]KAJ6150686.1 hypothetical protein N7470_007280 [Penicillium chermesinum]
MTSTMNESTDSSEPLPSIHSPPIPAITPIPATMDLITNSCLDVPDAAKYIGSTTSGITRIINRVKASTIKDTKYVKFTNVSPEVARGTDIKATRNFYDLQTRCMIITVPGLPHEQAIGELNTIMAIQSTISNLSIRNIATGRRTGQSSSKEPDSQWTPRNGRRAWPTVVLEAGYSESQQKLQCDAAWWIANSRGAVKLVITMAIDKRQPQIIIKCIVRDNNNLPGRNLRSRYYTTTRQQLTITRHRNTVTTQPAAPLRITVPEIMGRPPLQGETDILVPVPRLEELAAFVWLEQEI